MHTHAPKLLVSAFAVAILACTDAVHPIQATSGKVDPGPEPISDRLYFNSFESHQDTVGWPKNGGMTVSNDAAPDGGQRSVQIFGGCVVPHASLEIQGGEHDSYVKLKCWGKNLAIGGGLSLTVADESSPAIHIAVMDSSWTHYVSVDSLFCPAGKNLRIEMGAGGIAYSAMLVDMLEVKVVH